MSMNTVPQVPKLPNLTTVHREAIKLLKTVLQSECLGTGAVIWQSCSPLKWRFAFAGLGSLQVTLMCMCFCQREPVLSCPKPVAPHSSVHALREKGPLRKLIQQFNVQQHN